MAYYFHFRASRADCCLGLMFVETQKHLQVKVAFSTSDDFIKHHYSKMNHAVERWELV